MKRTLISRALLALCVAFVPFSLSAATCNSASGTSGSPSSWSATGTWSCSHVPTGGDDANISHYVRETGGLSFSYITLTIYINSGGTLRVNGNLSLEGSNLHIVVNGGTLDVTGGLTLNNGSTLTVNSGNVSIGSAVTLTNGNSVVNFNSTGTFTAGSISMSSDGSGKAFNVNAGTLTVTNGISIGSGSTVFVDEDATLNAATFTNSDSGSSILNIEGTANITGAVSQSGPINILSTTVSGTTYRGTLNVGGSVTATSTGNAVMSNYGYLNVLPSGNMTYPNNAKFYAYPGSQAIIGGNFTTENVAALNVGTNVAPPDYADVVIRGNLNASNSGDVIINQNGRMAVFGDINASSSDGTQITINSGGQIYVDGDGSGSSINFKASSGSSVTNNNSDISYNSGTTPYGFYVNGDMANEQGGQQPGTVATMQGSNLPFYNWVMSHSTGSFSTLPVILIFFNLQNETGEIVLQWATATEENFQEFILERSTDGKNFYEISRIAGAGFSRVRRDYSYEDKNPIVGRLYYRLKALDFDGALETFGVVKAEHEAQRKVAVYPNPVSKGESLNLATNFEPSTGDAIQVFDSTGKMIYSGTPDGMFNVLPFNVDLNTGTYILQYTAKGRMDTIRFAVK